MSVSVSICHACACVEMAIRVISHCLHMLAPLFYFSHTQFHIVIQQGAPRHVADKKLQFLIAKYKNNKLFSRPG